MVDLLLRTEASVAIGTGHVMRCLALAQAWQDAGGHAIFVMANCTDALERRLRVEGFETARASVQVGSPADASETARLAHKLDAAWVVVDGYEFGPEYQASLKRHGLKVLFVDDNGHAEHYSADLVLNQNVHASTALYPNREASTRLLLGPEFAMLRREFVAWRNWKRETPIVGRKVLLTMGGSDPDNITARVLRVMSTDLGVETKVVAGYNNPHLPGLRELSEHCGRVQLVANVTNMPELMAWADLAISGAGGTSYELCYMGMPSLLFVVAENQRHVAERLSELSAAIHAGRTNDFNAQRFAQELCRLIGDQERRLAMSNRARALVDGLGADRVRAALLNKELQLRQLRETDCQLLFSWANDPDVRSASFHSAGVQWEEHRQWFEQKLLAQKLPDPLSVIYIAETRDGEPLGQVRFHLDRDGPRQRATLSIVVAPQFRGSGWGKELIAFSIRMLAREHSIRRVDAFVKPENQFSIRLFESAGFRRSGTSQVEGQAALLFTWECGSGTHAN